MKIILHEEWHFKQQITGGIIYNRLREDPQDLVITLNHTPNVAGKN